MYPVVIEGDQLTLRELTRADADAVQQATSTRAAMQHLPMGPLAKDEATTYLGELMDAAIDPDRFLYSLAVVLQSNGQTIGLAQLSIESFTHRRAEIGYLLDASFWGRGYGTEAARLIADFGFDHLGLRRIFAIATPENVASRKLLIDLGFTLEGELRSHFLLGETWVDGEIFAKVSSETS